MRWPWLTAAAAGAIAVVLALTVGLYLGGQRRVVAQLCRWGLPNLTVPDRFRTAMQSRSTEQRCVLYGPRTRFQGVFLSDGFESSGFFPGRHIYESTVRRGPTYPGISISMDDRSDPDDLLSQFPTGPLGGLNVLVTFDGWMSEEFEGGFGHLGIHGQQVLVDRIVAASVPPEPSREDFRRWRRMRRAQQ